VTGVQTCALPISLQFRQAWYATLRFEGGQPLDLRPFLDQGVLAFDLQVADMAEGGVKFKLACGAGCERKVPYLRAARALAGRGPQAVAIALHCFQRDGADFSAVKLPFAIEASGSGELTVSRIRFLRQGQPNTPCPDHRSESVTPVMLDESWSINGWLPRHERKRAEARAALLAGPGPRLVFIGDSITEGWEKEGRAAWEHHFARHGALNLGFGGDHTENVLWRLQHGALDGLSPQAVVLMIGTNNTGDRQEDPRSTAAGIRRLLEEIRQRLPATPILLLAVFPREARPDGPLRKLNDRVNGLISAYADGRHIHFLNLEAALTQPDGSLSAALFPDALHLSEQGYAIWAEQLAPVLQALMSRGMPPSSTPSR
jgi:beta-glucosidase